MLRRKCLIRQIILGKIKGGMELKRSMGRRRKKMLDELREGTG
jgi:hypothetical protein